MNTIAISPTVHRQVIHQHLAVCQSCRELLAYARRAADFEALAAWRELLAIHLEPPPWRCLLTPYRFAAVDLWRSPPALRACSEQLESVVHLKTL